MLELLSPGKAAYQQGQSSSFPGQSTLVAAAAQSLQDLSLISGCVRWRQRLGLPPVTSPLQVMEREDQAVSAEGGGCLSKVSNREVGCPTSSGKHAGELSRATATDHSSGQGLAQRHISQRLTSDRGLAQRHAKGCNTRLPYISVAVLSRVSPGDCRATVMVIPEVFFFFFLALHYREPPALELLTQKKDSRKTSLLWSQ